MNKELLEEMLEEIEFLATHNKNLTNQQYYKILNIQDILKTMLEMEG